MKVDIEIFYLSGRTITDILRTPSLLLKGYRKHPNFGNFPSTFTSITVFKMLKPNINIGDLLGKGKNTIGDSAIRYSTLLFQIFKCKRKSDYSLRELLTLFSTHEQMEETAAMLEHRRDAHNKICPQLFRTLDHFLWFPSFPVSRETSIQL